jgi:spermidine/putrescine transport system permease protein
VLLGQDQLLHGQSRRPTAGAILLFAPMVLWIALFIVTPTLLMLVYSFATRDALGQVVYSFSLENYARILQPLYLGILWRSLVLAGITAFLCLTIGYPAAYFIARCAEPWRTRLLLAVMLPFWTSFLIRVYAWMAVFRSDGLLNAALETLGIVPRFMEPTSLMYTPTAVVVGMIYTFLPFMILPLYGSIEQLDPSLMQAAMNLGARPWRVFVEVVLPLTMPGVGAGLLLVFVPAIGMFAIPDLLGGAKVPMIGNVIQNQFGIARNPPFGAALGIVVLILFIAMFLLLGRRPRAARPARVARETA